jgi:hypothetical protein
MADGDRIIIGQANNASNPGEQTLLRRVAASNRTNPVFTVQSLQTQVGSDGIHGEASGDGTGVHGESTDGFGVRGISNFTDGVRGEASSDGAAGVRGESTDDEGYGVRGENRSGSGGAGVWGDSPTGFGVHGDSDSGIGVRAFSGDGDGVLALSTSGIGGVFGGGKAQLMLQPSSTLGRPTTGQHTKGELFMDSGGALFVCTADGTPGTWRRFSTTPAP